MKAIDMARKEHNAQTADFFCGFVVSSKPFLFEDFGAFCFQQGVTNGGFSITIISLYNLEVSFLLTVE